MVEMLMVMTHLKMMGMMKGMVEVVVRVQVGVVMRVLVILVTHLMRRRVMVILLASAVTFGILHGPGGGTTTAGRPRPSGFSVTSVGLGTTEFA